MPCQKPESILPFFTVYTMDKTGNHSTELFQFKSDKYYMQYDEGNHSDEYYRRQYSDEYILQFSLRDLVIGSVLLIPGFCAGLSTLVWSVRSLHQQFRGGTSVSAFLIFLLFSDIFELFLIFFMVLQQFFQQLDTPLNLHLPVEFLSVKLWGFYLHQLVALEGILSLRNPLFSSRLSSPLVSIPLSISLWMGASTFDFFKLAFLLNRIICGFTCVLAFFSCALTVKGFCSPEPTDRDKRLALKILVVAQVTLVGLNWPLMFQFFMPRYVKLYYSPFSIILLSLQLVSDPVLCVLVCRQKFR